jgi:hypothetical protein
VNLIFIPGDEGVDGEVIPGTSSDTDSDSEDSGKIKDHTSFICLLVTILIVSLGLSENVSNTVFRIHMCFLRI